MLRLRNSYGTNQHYLGVNYSTILNFIFLFSFFYFFYHVAWEQTPSGCHKIIWLTVVAGPLQQHGMTKLLSKHNRHRTPGNPLSRQWCLKKECCTGLWHHKSYVGVRRSNVEYSLRKLEGGSVCLDVFTLSVF